MIVVIAAWAGVGLMVAFLLWCVYDCGIDTGYTRCWNEHHRPPGTEDAK